VSAIEDILTIEPCLRYVEVVKKDEGLVDS
jgi:hypothetical protein